MTTSQPDRFELHVLGAPDLIAPDGRRLTSVLSQPSRLSLLAYLTLAPGPVTRASVVADFWPESDETRARNALSQALFYLRRSLGKEVVESVEGDRLWVSPEHVWCDAWELLTAERPSEEVMRRSSDDLLAGWNADESQPLQEWLDGMRRTVRARSAELEAERDAEEGDSVEVASHDRAGTADGALDSTGVANAGHDAPAAPGERRPVWARAIAAAALAGLALAVLIPLPGRTAEAERVAVLMPRVMQAAGSPELDPHTLNAELIERLTRRPGLEVVPAGFASSLGEFLSWRDRETVDPTTAETPAWILEVSVVVSDRAVNVVALLYRGPDLISPGGDSFDETYGAPEAVAVQVPRAIAERVAETVSDVIGH